MEMSAMDENGYEDVNCKAMIHGMIPDDSRSCFTQRRNEQEKR